MSCTISAGMRAVGALPVCAAPAFRAPLSCGAGAAFLAHPHHRHQAQGDFPARLPDTALVAILVYEKLGISLLRRVWFNVDLVWALALLITRACILLF